MFVETVDPERARTAIELGTVVQPREADTSTPYDASTDYGFSDAFGAAFSRENSVASLYHHLTAGDSVDAQDLQDGKNSDFNPYTFLKQNYDGDTLRRLAPAINDGQFEGAISPRLTKAIADDLLYEEVQKQKESASGFGTLLGALATQFVDPTSYIPVVGQGAKVGRVGKVGLFALNAMLSAGASEAVLQATQRSRSVQESLMNIGTAGIVGGGLGLFAAALSKGHNNPLLPENLDKNGEIVRTADGMDHLSPDELDRLEVNAAGDLGAARVTGSAQGVGTLARRAPTSVVGKTVRAVGDFLNSKTILGRVVRTTSPTALDLGQRLADPGGILLKQHLMGVGQTKSAEVIKLDYMSSEVEPLFNEFTQNLTRLNTELAKANGPKVDMTDVMLATQRHLYGMEDQQLDSALVQKYGQQAVQAIKKTAEENAAEIHRLNDVWEKRLTKEGLLQDQSLVSSLQGEVGKGGSLVAKIESHPGQLPDATPEQKADLTRLRSLRDVKRTQLQTELGKAVPLGNQYGHAQLWNREAALESPDDLKSFLMDALAITPDPQWLAEVHDLTPDALKALQKEDLTKYRSVLGDWAGDEHYWRITRSEAALAGAKEARKQAMLDLQESLRVAGEARRDEQAATLSEARTRRDKVAADLAEVRARRDALDAERRGLIEASTAARSQTLDRQRTATVQPSGLQSELNAALGPQHPNEAASLLSKDAKARRDVGDTSLDTANYQGRAEELARLSNEANARLRDLEARSRQLDEKLQRAEDAHREEKLMRQQLEDDVRYAREDRKIAERDLKKVKKVLRAARNATPLEDMVNEVYRHISEVGKISPSLMDRINEVSDRTTGRVKQRVINLSPEQRIEAIRQGWLKDDLSQILYHQYDQLASEMAMREGVGIGPNRRFESWADALRQVDEEFGQMISDAADDATKNALRKERRVITDDLVELRNRIKGNYDDDGTSFGWLKWASAKARQANYVRYGGGFLMSSLTDTATMALRHGGLFKVLREFAGPAIREMRNAYEHAPSEFQSFIAATELGMGAATSARRWGSEDLIHGHYANYGIGYGRTRQITGAIDKALDKTGHVVATFSGLPLWNRFWKTVAGLSMSSRLNKLVRSYDTLKPAEIADLASLGIGRTEAARLREYLTKFGAEVDGRFDPHLEKWGNDDVANEAARDFRIAIQRDMNRAINTPGIGDTPRLMSKWYGRLLFQFQTFAFTFMNRYAYPVVQRATMFRERQAFMSMGILLGASAMVMLGHDIINGRDPADRFRDGNEFKTIQELVDRSGMVGWTSPYVDSILKLSGPLTGYNGTDRYASNNALDSLLGINFRLFHDIQGAGSAAFARDPKVVQKLLTLAPFNTWSRLIYNQFIDR